MGFWGFGEREGDKGASTEVLGPRSQVRGYRSDLPPYRKARTADGGSRSQDVRRDGDQRERALAAAN